MSDAAVLGTTTAVAVALVPIVSLIKNPKWGTKVNYAIGMVAAIVSAIAGAIMDGGVGAPNEWAARVLVALGASQTVYMLYFRDTDLNEKLTGNDDTGN